jgi:predicted nucleic acid-binding protein
MRGDLVAFLDSNVLVYAVSRNEPEKQEKARALIERGFAEGCFAISTQVLLEVYVNVTQKAKIRLPPREAFEYVKAFTEWRVVEMSQSLVLAALGLSRSLQISTWDAAILEAAREAGCSRVLTEDLASGRDYGGITVENPFS